jgi:hypothetical protein
MLYGLIFSKLFLKALINFLNILILLKLNNNQIIKLMQYNSNCYFEFGNNFTAT